MVRVFETHSIVGVGDPHGHERASAFRYASCATGVSRTSSTTS
jgi:hypothetical protein